MRTFKGRTAGNWRTAGAAAALFLGAGWAVPGHATNGYFVAGYDVQSNGMAGVGVSSLNGVGAAAANPALGVKAGNSAGACLSFFMPHRDATVSSAVGGAPLTPGTYDSGEEFFLIPCLGANFKLDDKSALSLLLYANGGMNTHYDSNPFTFGGGFQASTPLGVDLEQVFLQPSYAREVGYGVTLGGGPVFAMQRFMAQGLQPFDNGFFSSNPHHVTNNGYDYSFGGGLKVGGTWEPVPWLTAGVSYQTKMWMSRFERYSGLFADGGNFDIPASVTEGVTIRPIPTLDVSLEHQHIFYGDVASIANGQNNSLTGGVPLGAPGGSGFGWKDMNVYRIGAQWKAVDFLTLRGGYSHATDFTTGENLMFNILAPATVKDHASIGGTYQIDQNWDVSLAYTHAFSQSFTANANPLSPSQSIKLRMDQDEVAIGFKYRW